MPDESQLTQALAARILTDLTKEDPRWDCPTCNGTGEAAAHILKDLAEEDPLAAALLHEAMEEGRASISCKCDDALGESCPNCHPLGDGEGGYYPNDHLWNGPCECAHCTPPPKPSPPKQDDFRCPEHGQPITRHVALPEGGYRRVCPECPPVDLVALTAEANALRDAREAARNEQRK